MNLNLLNGNEIVSENAILYSTDVAAVSVVVMFCVCPSVFAFAELTNRICVYDRAIAEKKQ